MRGRRKGLWAGGATAANECEGGYVEDRESNATEDVIPQGTNRKAVIKGEMQ